MSKAEPLGNSEAGLSNSEPPLFWVPDAGIFLFRQDEYVKHTLKLSFWVVKRMIF